MEARKARTGCRVGAPRARTFESGASILRSEKCCELRKMRLSLNALIQERPRAKALITDYPDYPNYADRSVDTAAASSPGKPPRFRTRRHALVLNFFGAAGRTGGD